MADLRISYQDLETTKATMGSLVNEFQNIQTEQSQYDSAMGSGQVAGALNSFAGNWSYHRKQLLGKMEDLDGMVSEALTQFPKTDGGLASSLKGKS
jgi:hypothetical protein